MSEWSFHVQQRDRFRLMAMFAERQDLGRRFELLAHTHSRLARRALASGR